MYDDCNKSRLPSSVNTNLILESFHDLLSNSSSRTHCTFCDTRSSFLIKSQKHEKIDRVLLDRKKSERCTLIDIGESLSSIYSDFRLLSCCFSLLSFV